MSNRPVYRTRQFLAALRPRVNGDRYAEACALLGPGLTRLFDSMSPRDRVHCLDVYQRLVEGGCIDRDVLTAALLHDSGKGNLSGSRVQLWHRVAYVLLHATAPSALDRLAQRHGGLSVLQRHAEIGALLADAMGAPPRVVKMIEEHEARHHDDPLQQQLRAADDQS